MIKELITAGELAKLAGTTKRTIHFYGEKGILKPVSISESHYRLYEERQILDYQMILLLSTLGVSLDEMKEYLKKKGDLTALFLYKKKLIMEKMELLQFNLNNVNTYVHNLKNNGTMINPTIKTIRPFDVYYIQKIGPYAKIDSYCKELITMFENKNGNFTTLSIFNDQGYRPKLSHIKIGVLARKEMTVKMKYKKMVKRMTFSPGKVISYTYHGPGNMLSLFWKELEKYCRLKKIKVRTDIPDYEVYWEVNNNLVKQKFEIFLPIR